MLGGGHISVGRWTHQRWAVDTSALGGGHISDGRTKDCRHRCIAGTSSLDFSGIGLFKNHFLEFHKVVQ